MHSESNDFRNEDNLRNMEFTRNWMTSQEAAAYLKLSPRTIVAMARDGRLPAHMLCGAQRHIWSFLAEELDATMNAPAVLSIEGREIN